MQLDQNCKRNPLQMKSVEDEWEQTAMKMQLLQSLRKTTAE
jgi:hypothetical protein